ncbi:MAG: ion transporter [Oscillospiraceae bacterium]|nr:ion transporter [Oscillospiraceae bacterium]
MRKRIYELVEVSQEGDKLSAIYDYLMMIAIVASLVPLVFKETNMAFQIIDKVTVSLFVIDYLFRLITADFKIKKKLPFLRYPFTMMAIIDLVSILPSFLPVNSGLKVLRVLRMARTLRAFRAFRAFKIARYSKSLQIIGRVMKSSKSALLAVATLAGGYILVSALVVFNVEPDSFNDFFEAIYWATVSLTTVGYGDIYPVTTIGRVVTMISSVFGIAIVALPAGIITAGYMTEIQSHKANSFTDDI